jgi:hypothetical protein
VLLKRKMMMMMMLMMRKGGIELAAAEVLSFHEQMLVVQVQVQVQVQVLVQMQVQMQVRMQLHQVQLRVVEQVQGQHWLWVLSFAVLLGPVHVLLTTTFSFSMALTMWTRMKTWAELTILTMRSVVTMWTRMKTRA